MTTRMEWSENHITEGSRVYLNVLSYGSSGSAVKQLQQALKSCGYDLGSSGVDGKFGTKTEAALKAWQRDNNQNQTGQISASQINTIGLSSAGTESKFGLGLDLSANVLPVDAAMPTLVKGAIIVAAIAAIGYISILMYGKTK